VADVLVDTDVFVDHLRGAAALEPGPDTVSYSVVTRCELFAGRQTEEAKVGALLAPFRELAVDRAVAELAGRLRRETALRTPDALIAATALHHRLTLVTRNRRDFEAVARLRVRQPRQP
jgi:hypothetical protein